jgi:hypothetical protein
VWCGVRGTPGVPGRAPRHGGTARGERDGQRRPRRRGPAGSRRRCGGRGLNAATGAAGHDRGRTRDAGGSRRISRRDRPGRQHAVTGGGGRVRHGAPAASRGNPAALSGHSGRSSPMPPQRRPRRQEPLGAHRRAATQPCRATGVHRGRGRTGRRDVNDREGSRRRPGGARPCAGRAPAVRNRSGYVRPAVRVQPAPCDSPHGPVLERPMPRPRTGLQTRPADALQEAQGQDLLTTGETP